MSAQPPPAEARIEDWNEVRTAWTVARLGAFTAAAEALGLHHSTVLRHVDRLEARLGVRLFQRHSRGCAPTDAGRLLLEVAGITAEQFERLPARLSGPEAEIRGRIIVTTVDPLADRLLAPIARFRARHPDVQVDVVAESRRLRLEYGEAHVSLRPGAPPAEPDNIARPLAPVDVALFASEAYAARHGRPAHLDDLAGHRFVGLMRTDPRAKSLIWLATAVPPEQVVYRGPDVRAGRAAVLAGLGIAPLVTLWPEPGLVRLSPPVEDWRTPLWLVTHRDSRRMPKVRAFCEVIEEMFGAGR